MQLMPGQEAQRVDEGRVIKYNNEEKYKIPANAHLNKMMNLGACPGLFHVNAHIPPDQLTCVHRFFRVRRLLALRDDLADHQRPSRLRRTECTRPRPAVDEEESGQQKRLRCVQVDVWPLAQGFEDAGAAGFGRH